MEPFLHIIRPYAPVIGPCAPASSRSSNLLRQSQQSPTLSLIIPTLNESANIRPLLSRINQAVGGIATEIVFVDDSSDDTPQVIDTAAREVPLTISIIHRPPEQRRGGLAGAVLEGSAAARGEWLCVMDADLQHPPELLPQMLMRTQEPACDIVIGSRYVKGGSADGLGSGLRKLISHASRWASRLLFAERLWRISDPCAGFFLVRGSLLRQVELKPIGFKILLEILVRTQWERVVEVPYRFESRAGGVSKATFAQGRAFLKHLLKLLLEVPGAGRFYKFAVVGASGILVNLGILWLLALAAGVNQWAAWVIAVESSILWNYVGNRTLTWADRTHGQAAKLWREFPAYQGVASLALVTNGVIFALLATLFQLHLLAAGLLGILAGIAINFMGADRVVFGRLLYGRSELTAAQADGRLSAEAK